MQPRTYESVVAVKERPGRAKGARSRIVRCVRTPKALGSGDRELAIELWRPKHYGYVRDPGTTSVGFGRRGTPDGRRSALPSFVPPRLGPLILKASQRRNVSAALLAAQLYAESGFNPFAVSPAGAKGLAQFMPGTARSYGLRDPFDPEQSIDAQARLMRDLLRRFASVPLALAAYNAGSAAVARCGCNPPYAETQACVSRILGLLGGARDLAMPTFGVHLVE